MKTCPACGYGNGDDALKCGICGGRIAGRQPDAAPGKTAKRTDSGTGLLALLILAAVIYFGPRGGAPPAGPQKDAPAAAAVSNDGVIYTLEKMSALKLPGAAERAAALAAFDNPDWRVRTAAAKTAGVWLRAGAADSDPLQFRLVSALRDPSGPVRKEAAMEAGLLIGLGLMSAAAVPGLEKTVRSFMDDGADAVKSAGYFLAAMSGLSGLKGRLEYAAAREPLPMTRLYAACALAGLGSEDAARAVFKAARDPDPGVRKEAALCLSYAASPDSVPLLRKLSASDADFETADNARFSLNLRKQLAIIRNKPG